MLYSLVYASVVLPAACRAGWPLPPASALEPHPAHVCSAARVCTRRCRRCLWLALLLGCGLARAADYECSLHLETMVSLARRWGRPLARPARGKRAAPAHSMCLPQPLKRGGGGKDQHSSLLNVWWEICAVVRKIRYLRGLELRRESAGALLIRAFTPRSTDPLLHTLR